MISHNTNKQNKGRSSSKGRGVKPLESHTYEVFRGVGPKILKANEVSIKRKRKKPHAKRPTYASSHRGEWGLFGGKGLQGGKLSIIWEGKKSLAIDSAERMGHL